MRTASPKAVTARGAIRDHQKQKRCAASAEPFARTSTVQGSISEAEVRGGRLKAWPGHGLRIFLDEALNRDPRE